MQVLTRAEEDQVDVIPTNAVAAHVKLFHLAMAFADGLEDLYESLVVDLVLTQVQIGQTPMIVHCTTKLRHIAVTQLVMVQNQLVQHGELIEQLGDLGQGFASKVITGEVDALERHRLYPIR